MANQEFEVRPYLLDDAAALAVMWNESDDQWPGTWNNGVPMTAERVRDWLSSQQPLQGLVVEETATKIITAYGSLYDEPAEERTAYVSLLNVHPGYQGRSLCRRMLTQMVDVALEHDYNRLTLGTWSANLKAVPLYKKTGFFWVPDTQVFMVNYLPAIRRLAAGQRFFARHDWYTTFRRELTQTEDDQRHPATGNMKVFIYRWEAGDDLLEVLIDSEGQAITGLETNDFAAYAYVDESEPAQGLPYPVHWRLVNKGDEPISIVLNAWGEPGVDIDLHHQITLTPGETQLLDAEFWCQTDARKLTEKDKYKPAPRIQTELTIGDETIIFGTGLRYHPAIEVSSEPRIPSLLPGTAQEIQLQIRNHLPRSVQGHLDLTLPDGLTVSAPNLNFTAEANSYAGLPITVTCQRESAPLSVTATFAENGVQITTAPDRIALLAAPLGGLAVDQTDEKILVENDYFRLQMEPRGGSFSLWDKRLGRNRLGRSGEEFGTPFRPSDLGDNDYALSLEQGQGWVKISSTITAQRFAGLQLRREILLNVSPLVEIRYVTINHGDAAHTFQLQARLRFQGEDAGDYVIPRQVGLLTLPCTDLADGDFPKKPADMAERWLARCNEGVVSGMLWPADLEKHEFDWGFLSMETPALTLEPGQSQSFGPIYAYNAPGDWRDIRHWWQRLNGEADIRPRMYSEPQSPLRYRFQDEPLITLSNRLETELHLSNDRERAVSGRVTIQPPTGWQADQTDLPMTHLKEDKPIQQPVTFQTHSNEIGPFVGQLALSTDLVDESRPFTLLRLGDEQKSVQVQETTGANNDRLLTIDNERCQWQVAPDFQAGLVGWRENGRETNHLFTAYPDPGQHSWLKPWYGGVRPILNADGAGDWPGRLHDETFAADTINLTDNRGIIWTGVRLTTQVQRKGFEGIGVTLDYLTVGGGNILKVVYRISNATTAHREVKAALFAYLQVDGTHKNGVLYGEGKQRKRTPHSTWQVAHPWGAVVNPDTGRAVVMVKGSRDQGLELGDWGEAGGHLISGKSPTVKPENEVAFTTYLALTDSLESARQYGALCEVG